VRDFSRMPEIRRFFGRNAASIEFKCSGRTFHRRGAPGYPECFDRCSSNRGARHGGFCRDRGHGGVGGSILASVARAKRRRLLAEDPNINEVVFRRLVLLGEGPPDRKLRAPAPAPATVVEAKPRPVLDDLGLALCRHVGRAFRCCFLSSQRLGFARCEARRRNGGTGSC
jgi:hypothetical protein